MCFVNFVSRIVKVTEVESTRIQLIPLRQLHPHLKGLTLLAVASYSGGALNLVVSNVPDS